VGAYVSNSLILTFCLLGGLGFLVPRLLARLLPEGVKPLILNALLSVCALIVLSGGMFLGLYLLRGVSAGQVLQPGTSAAFGHFLWLGMMSSLIWGPIMLLSVAGLPRHWVEETW